MIKFIKSIIEMPVLVEKQARHIQNLENTISNSVAYGPISEYGGECNIGNPYRTYSQKVFVLRSMFNGCAPWGNQYVKTLAQLRSIFIIGGRPKVKKHKNADETDFDRAKEYMEKFFSLNGFDKAFGFQLGIESELEGKCLVRLFPNAELRNFDCKWVPWYKYNYKVYQNPDDYSLIDKIEYNVNNIQYSIKDHFVYSTFGGSLAEMNETTPTLGLCIKDYEDFDKCIFDWRRINHLFASPTPWFDFDDAVDAQEFDENLNKKDWKIGKAVVTSKARFSFITIDRAGVDSLRLEAEHHAKTISGVTSIPIHFLGFPDLMNNRATADSLGSLINLATSADRTIWLQFYNNLKDEVIDYANEMFNAGLDKNAIEIILPSISTETLKLITEVYLVMRNSGALSLQSLWELLPDIDPEIEQARIEEEMQSLPVMNPNGNNVPRKDTRNIDVTKEGGNGNPYGNFRANPEVEVTQ